MNNLKKRIYFKVIAFTVLQVFLLTQIVFAAVYLPNHSTTGISDLSQAQTKEIEEGVPPVTVYGELETQEESSVSETEQAGAENVIAALEDEPAALKASTLKAMGSSVGAAATALIKDNMSAKETSAVLIEAGYDKTKVDNYLGNIVASETKGKQSNQISAEKDIVDNKTSEIVKPEASIENNAVSTNDKKTISTEVTQTETTETSTSTVEQGTSNTQTVAALKEQGMSATDILKAATDSGKDMKTVAAEMKDAGFSNVEIVQAYISKAIGWASDTTVDVVNCAVQSLAEVLSGQDSIVSTVSLAYEVIVSDIMNTGKVTIEDGQIMSSMSAIQNVASEHGVDLAGVNGTMTDLENASGSTIVHVDGNHWITVKDITGDTVTVMDNGTEVAMTKAELQSRWDGNMLTKDTSYNATTLTSSQMNNIVGAWDDGDNNGDTEGFGADPDDGNNESEGEGPGESSGNESNGNEHNGNENNGNNSGNNAGNNSGNNAGNNNSGNNSSNNSGNNSSEKGSTAKAEKAETAVAEVNQVDTDPAKAGAAAVETAPEVETELEVDTTLEVEKSPEVEKTLEATTALEVEKAPEKGLIGQAIDTVAGAISAVADKTSSAMGKVGEMVDKAIDTVAGAITSVGEKVDNWGKDLSEWGKEKGGFFGGAAQAVGGLMSVAGKGVKGIGAAVDMAGNVVETTAKAAGGVIGMALGTKTGYGLSAELSMSITGKSVHKGMLGVKDPSKQTVTVTLGFGQLNKAGLVALESMAKKANVNVEVVSYDINNPQHVSAVTQTKAQSAMQDDFAGFVDISYGSALSTAAQEEAVSQLSAEEQEALSSAKTAHVSSVAAGNANVPAEGTMARAACDMLDIGYRLDTLNTAANNLDTALSNKNNSFHVGTLDSHYNSTKQGYAAITANAMVNGNLYSGAGHVTGVLDSQQFANSISEQFGLDNQNNDYENYR